MSPPQMSETANAACDRGEEQRTNKKNSYSLLAARMAKNAKDSQHDWRDGNDGRQQAAPK